MAGRAKDGLEESMMSKEKNATPSHGPKLKEGNLVSCKHAGDIVYGLVEWERAGSVCVKVLIKTQDSFISHEPPQYITLHRTMLSLVRQEEPEISEDEEEHNQQQDPSTQTTPSTEIGTRITSSTGTGAESRANNLEVLLPLEGQEEVDGFQIGKRVTVHDCGEGLIHWMAYASQGRLMLGLEMDKPSHSYNTRPFGVTLPYECDPLRAHIISSLACSILSQPVEDGPRALSEDEMTRFEIKKFLGRKEVVEGQPGKGIVRWIGYLPGEAHISVGYEMDKTRSSYSNGNYGDWQVFNCRKNTGFFQPLYHDHPHRTDRSLRIPVHQQQPTHVDLPEVKKTIPAGTRTASTSKQAPLEQVPPQSLTPEQHQLDFSVGDVVLVKGKEGTVCWIGYHGERRRILVGLDMMEDSPKHNFGYLHRYKLFDTGGRRSSLFVTAQSCTKPDKVDTCAQHGAELPPDPGLSSANSSLDSNNRYRQGPRSEQENAEPVHVTEKTHPTLSDASLPSVVCEKDGSKPSRVGLVHQTSEHLGIESEIGDRVQLKDGRSCTLKWAGTTASKSKAIIGVEMDEDMPLGTDGTWIDGHRYFECPPKRALFVHPDVCLAPQYIRPPISVPVTGNPQAPVAVHDPESVSGSWKGIQGSDKSHNLELVVYSLFAYNNNIDDELLRITTDVDRYLHEQVQQILKENIVNPLRKTSYVSANHVEELLNLIDTVKTLNGIFAAEHDPVADMEYLLKMLFGSKSLMRFSNGMKCTCYPIGLTMVRQHDNPTVQTLLEESLFEKRAQFTEPPGCLLVHTSASGDHKEMYPNIMPSVILDVTYMLQSANRSCHLCGGLGMLECRSCFENIPSNGLGDIVFCAGCNLTWHGHADRQGHQPYSLPDTPMPQAAARPRQHLMELFAVVTKCESRYLSYVKSGSQDKPLWLCMDAKKEKIDGIKGTFYTPTVDVCEHLQEWLAGKNLLSVPPESSPAPLKYASPLVKDAYIYFYRPVKMDM